MKKALSLTIYGVLLVAFPWCNDPWMAPRLFILALGALVMWWRVVKDCHWTRSTRMDWPALGLLTVAFASFIVNGSPWAGFYGQYRQLALGLQPMMLYFLVAYAVCHHPKAYAWSTMDAASRAAVLLVGLAIFQAAIEGEPFMGTYLPGGRPIASLGSPVFLSAVLAVIAPLALHGILERGKDPVILILIGVGLALTRTRGGCIAAVVGCGAYMVMTHRLRWQLIAGVVAMGLFFGTRIPVKQKGDSMRLATYRSAFEAIADKPLLGFGPDNFLEAFYKHENLAWFRGVKTTLSVQDHAHNDVLEVAATLGLLGLLFYVVLILSVFVCESPARLGFNGEGAALRGSLAALWAASWFNPVPLPALALGAIVTGHLLKESPTLEIHDGARPRHFGFGVALMVFMLVSIFTVADMAYNASIESFHAGNTLGGVRWLRMATSMNPGESRYQSTALESLFSMAASNKKVRSQLIEEAVLIAADEARRAPRSIVAAEHLGGARLIYSAHGGADYYLPAAITELERSLTLAPMYTGSMQFLLQAYRAHGDRQKYEALAKRYREIVAASSGRHDEYEKAVRYCKFCRKEWPHKGE